MSKRKKKQKKKKEQQQFLVDYDLKGKCRKAFYKELKNPKHKARKSTKSVLITDNIGEAKILHKKASRCGRANIYRVKKVAKA